MALFDAVATASAERFGSEQAYTSFLETEASPRIIGAILPGELPKLASVLDEFEICHDDQVYVVPKRPLVLELPTDPDSDLDEFKEMQRAPAPAVVYRVEMPHGLWERSAPAGLGFALRIHVDEARGVLNETLLARTSYWAARWSAARPPDVDDQAVAPQPAITNSSPDARKQVISVPLIPSGESWTFPDVRPQGKFYERHHLLCDGLNDETKSKSLSVRFARLRSRAACCSVAPLSRIQLTRGSGALETRARSLMTRR